MRDRLEIWTLGGLTIKRGETAVDGLVSRKAEALLVYLAYTGRPQPRQVLANLLWDDGSDRRQMNSLRVLLTNLRREVGPYVTITRDTVTFNQDSPYWLDVAVLEEGLSTIQLRDSTLSSEEMARLTQLLSLYQDDFLHGFYLHSGRGFEEWLVLERERLRLQVLEALQALINASLILNQYQTGLEHAGRLLRLDPLHEEAHHQKIRLLAASGQRHAALAHYDHYCQLLAGELGAEPVTEITTLYQQLKTGQLDATGRPTSVAAPLLTDPSAALPPCPYRGLSSFREADRSFFFGRESFTARLIGAVQRHPVVAVVGPSGCGKTSVVMAGLLPHLRQAEFTTAEQRETPPGSIEPQNGDDGGAGPWIIATLRPSRYPCRALAGALIPLLQPHLDETKRLIEASQLAHGLCQADFYLSDVIEQLLRKAPANSRMLLVVDQFEELYTLCPEPETCQCFLTNLLNPLSSLGADTPVLQSLAGTLRVHLVLTLRADFLGHILTDQQPLADALQDSTLILGSMTRQELGRAVSQPAVGQGLTFETGLVDRILDDVGYLPGQLPLLEFALTTLWEQKTVANDHLTHAAYEAIGRVQGALAQYADGLYVSLSPAEQEQTRQILVQLVRPGQQTADARRQATRAELGEANWALVQHLADARLVVTGRDPTGQETVELVHETLIQAWGRLAAWLQEARTFRQWQEQLRMAIRQWETSGQDNSALWRGTLLNQAEVWTDSRATDLSLDEQAFLQASRALREQELRTAEAQRQHDLTLARSLADTERQRAEAQARASIRLRWLTAGLAMVLLLAVGAALLAIDQWQAAQRQARLALAHQLAAEARAYLGDQPALALLLSVEADRLADLNEDRNNLLVDLKVSPHLARFLAGHMGFVNSVAISPDGQTLVSGSDDDTIILWDLTNGRLGGSPLAAHDADVNSVAFSPNGATLASGGSDHAVILWDADSQQPRSPPLIGHTDAVASVAFSPDGQRLASASRDNTVIRWEVSTGQPVGEPLAGHSGGGVKQVAFSPDGRILASAGGDQTVILWEAATGQKLRPPLIGHTQPVNTVAFSPDGTILASGSSDHTVILWNVQTGQPLGKPLAAHTEAVNTVVFSPDGTILASGSSDHTVILWEVASGQPVAPPLITHHGDILALAFSPDGQTLVSSSANPTIVLWDITAAQLLTGHRDSVNQVAFGPVGRLLASGSDDDTIMLWDVATHQPSSLSLSGHMDDVLSVAFSPDGQILASASSDQTIILWNVETSQPLGQPLGTPGWASTVSFSPDGQTLASGGGDDNSIVLWEIATGQSLGSPLSGHRDFVTSVTFSPDGQVLASGSADQTIILWEVATGQPRYELLTGHTGHVEDVAFSPDGRLLASATDEDTIILWEVATGQPLGPPLTGHTGHVEDVAFSPDGRLLASCSRDNTVILWDVADHKPFAPPLIGHTDWIWSIAFSPDGQLLASGSRDGTIILWQLNEEPWPVRACTIANRNLTPVEWDRFIGLDIPYRLTCPNLPTEDLQ